jgi:hypothetical protein
MLVMPNQTRTKATSIKEISSRQIVHRPHSEGAIIRADFPGFKEDYLAIHSLIRKYRPKTLLEIGTSAGSGTNVICNAMGIKKGWRRLFQNPAKKVYSIDVPPGTDPSLIYPGQNPEDGHPEKAGAHCTFPYTQLFGNSIEYDFSPHYPLEAWFIDGKHNYEYAKKDTEQALKAKPRLIIWHDLQIPEVEQAVVDAMAGQPYDLKRVKGTRIGYAVRRS